MTIALLRLYPKKTQEQRKSKVFNVGVSFFWIEIPRLIPLGKIVVTIDDYRATAYVQTHPRQSTESQKSLT